MAIEPRLLDTIRLSTRATAWFAGLLVLISALLIGGDVVARNLFTRVPFQSFELSRYLFGAAVAFGLAFALSERAHIRIDPLVKLLPAGPRAVLDVVALAATVPVAAAMAWAGWSTVAESARLGARSTSALAAPLVIPQGIWAAGLTFFALVAALLAGLALAALITGRPRTVDAIAGLPGLETEMPETLEAPDRAALSSGAGEARL